MKLRTTLFFVIVVLLSLVVNLTTSFAQTVVSVQPAEVPSPAVGGQLTVNIDITGGIGVAGYQVTVNFDPTALRYVSIRNADYLPAGAFVAPVDITDSSVTIHTTAIGSSANGNGTLATVTFQVVEVKTSTLRLTDVALSDITGQSLAVTTADGIVTGQATPPSAVVSVQPAEVPSPAVGGQLTVNIDITGGVGVAGYQVTVNFDPTALRYVSIRNADYLPAGAFVPPVETTDSSVTIAAAVLGASTNGNGTLATVTFQVVEVKTSTLRLTDVALSDPAAQSLAVTTADGIVTGQATPPSTDVYMYWASWGLGSIQRAKLDGTNLQNLVTGLTWPRDIALNIAQNKMYWVDAGANKVQRANLDGTNVEDLVNVPGHPFGVAVDAMNGKVYWSVWGPGKIQRANLDGTNVEDFITGLSEPEDIDLDLSAGKIYWTDTVTNKIQRANLDGSNIEDLVTAGLSHSLGMVLDVAGGKMYWTNTSFYGGPWPGHDKIQRANLDGTNVEDLVTTGLSVAHGIALDISAGKMYWADAGKIQRANLDGSNVEDAIVGSADVPIAPTGIVLGIPQTLGLRLNPNVIADQTFFVKTPIQPLDLPPAEGGTQPYIYTLAPIPAGLSFDAGTQVLSGVPTTVGDTVATYTATDAIGASASLTFTIAVEVNLDVNGDGKVDVLDLVWVAVSYGMRGTNLPADVNADGVVNVPDLIAVAESIDAGAALPAKVVEEVLFAAEAAAAELEAGAGAPVMRFNTPPQTAYGITAYDNVAAALADARSFASSDVRLGKWMPLLEELRQLLAEIATTPETTALLPNYPNPFNPETWIPYHLAKAANVTLTIYDVRGSVVRELRLEHQPAGVYESRRRAAYWDGKNQIGEKVASGLYFYTLTTKGFTATRKMLIAK